MVVTCVTMHAILMIPHGNIGLAFTCPCHPAMTWHVCSHVFHVPAPLWDGTGTHIHICCIPALPHDIVAYIYAMPQSHCPAECVCLVTHVPWPRSIIWQLGQTCSYTCHVLAPSLTSVHMPALLYAMTQHCQMAVWAHLFAHTP